MTRDQDPRPGRLLLDVRTAAGLTQTEVAGRAGVPQSMVSAYESGVRQPTVPVLGRLLEAMEHELVLTAQPLPAPLLVLSGPIGMRVRRHRHQVVELAGRHGVHRLQVFGRVARGEDRPGDALDLLADADGSTLTRLLLVSAELQDVLDAPVNLVPQRQLSAARLADLLPELVAL